MSNKCKIFATKRQRPFVKIRINYSFLFKDDWPFAQLLKWEYLDFRFNNVLDEIFNSILNINFMKTFLSSFLFILGILSVNAQDIITKKNSDDINAKILEVTSTEIKFKRFEDLNGPTFTLLKSEVLMVRYENGTKDIFNDKTFTASSDDEMRTKGKQDAKIYYKGAKSGAGWTAATTVLTSPLFGLIPAVICASTEPSDDNLNYKDSELMKNHAYNEAYTKQALKIKRRKIWTNYGIGSGVWILLIALL